MKKFLIALCLCASVAAFAALTSTTAFYRFQCDPVFNADGTARSAVVQAYWQTTVVDDNGAVIAAQLSAPVQWDAVAKATNTVTANGKTYTYAEVLSAVMAIAAQEKAAQATH